MGYDLHIIDLDVHSDAILLGRCRKRKQKQLKQGYVTEDTQGEGFTDLVL